MARRRRATQIEEGYVPPCKRVTTVEKKLEVVSALEVPSGARSQ